MDMENETGVPSQAPQQSKAWLVTFTDMVSLVLTFFVLLFSMSSVKIDDWENMIEFWYIVRNNLFHGAKNIVEERDQFLVQYGYLTLRELMEILLHD